MYLVGAAPHDSWNDSLSDEEEEGDVGRTENAFQQLDAREDEMKEALDGNAQALAKVLEAVPEVVLVVDREGTIRYINRVEEGYDRDEVLGMQADAIMSPESKEVFRATLECVLRTAQVQEYESKVSAPDGGIQWYRSRMVPLYDDGEVVGAMVMATNISELKAAQETADQLRRLLPMCAWCDRIRNDKGEWETVEVYLEKEGGTKVSHGLCPRCERDRLGGKNGGDSDSNGNVA